MTGGTVDAYSGDTFLSRVVLGSAPSTPVRWSLAGIPVTDNAADITLRTDLTGEGTCRFDPETPFRVVGMTVAYSGNPTVPAMVADFLPPVLTAIDLFVPATPSPTEASAAIDLAMAVVGRYKPTPVAIRTRPLPTSGAPDVAQDPTVRQIVLGENVPRGTALRTGTFGPYLQIGGRGNDLLTQSQLITSQVSTVAVASAAIAGQSAPAPQVTPTISTLADLGVGDSESTGTGRAVIGSDSIRHASEARHTTCASRSGAPTRPCPPTAVAASWCGPERRRSPRGPPTPQETSTDGWTSPTDS